jgi:hypothetical protein
MKLINSSWRTLTTFVISEGWPSSARHDCSVCPPWPFAPPFCFVGFGTDRLRRQEAMKTASRENPNHGLAWTRNRAHGAVDQNRTRSIKWDEKQKKFQPKEMCFFLTSPFIELAKVFIFVSAVVVMCQKGTRQSR